MTEKMNQVTLEDYYRESNPKRRGEILKCLMQQDFGEENQGRKELYDLRYAGKSQRKDGEAADGYIGLWMTMKLSVDNSTGFFGSRSAKRELNQFLKKLGISDYMNKGEFGRKLLYDEFYHMTALYVQSSLTDRNYTSSFMGLVAMKEDQVKLKLTKDVYKVAYLMPMRAKMEEEFSVFTQAATDAFCAILPECKGQLEELMGTAL